MPLKRFLIAESDPDFSKILRETLERYQVDFEIVSNGKDFYEKIVTYKPDLMILAVELPDQNGFALCKKIKEDTAIRGIPLVITVTPSNAEAAKSHQKIRTKADAYFIKPINVNNFIGYLEELLMAPLKKKGPTEPTFREVAVKAKTETGPEFKRIDTLSDRKDEKIKIEKELLEREVKALREEVQILKTKVEGLIDEKGNLEDRLRQKETEMKRLRVSLETENRRLKDALIEKDIDLKNVEKKSREEIEKERSEKADLMRKIDELNNEYQRKEKQIILNFNREKSAYEEEINKYKKILSEKDSQINEKIKDIEVQKKLSIELEKRLKEFEERVSNEQRKVVSMEDEINKFKGELVENKKLIDSYVERLKESESEKEMYKKRIEELERTINELNAKIAVQPITPSLEEQQPPLLSQNELEREEEGLIEFPLKYTEDKEQREGAPKFDKVIEEPVSELKGKAGLTEGVIEIEDKGENIEKDEFEVTAEDEQFSDDSALASLDNIFKDNEEIEEESLSKRDDSKIDSLSSMLIKYIDEYNSVFTSIFTKVREKSSELDVQKIFNDYFRDLSDEGKTIFAGIQFNTVGEIDAFQLTRNVINFLEESELAENEKDRAAYELLQNILMDLIEFMSFTATNVMPSNEGKELKKSLLEKIERLKKPFIPINH